MLYLLVIQIARTAIDNLIGSKLPRLDSTFSILNRTAIFKMDRYEQGM